MPVFLVLPSTLRRFTIMFNDLANLCSKYLFHGNLYLSIYVYISISSTNVLYYKPKRKAEQCTLSKVIRTTYATINHSYVMSSFVILMLCKIQYIFYKCSGNFILLNNAPSQYEQVSILIIKIA